MLKEAKNSYKPQK